MEIEQVLKDIAKLDDNLAKRLTPLEASLKDYKDDLSSTQKTLKEQQEDNAGLRKLLEAQGEEMHDLRALVKATRKNVYAPDGSYKGGFVNAETAKCFGHYIMARFGQSEVSREYVEKELGESTISGGGALVPEAFMPSLITLIETHGVFRRNVRVVPMGDATSTWPKLDSDVTVYVPGEGNAITKSDPGFSNVTLVAKKFATLTAISNELAEDSALAIGEIVGSSIARALAKAEDQIGFLGDGTSTYWGMTGITGSLLAVDGTIANIKSLKVGTGNAYSELILPDFDGVVAILPIYAYAGAKWYMSSLFFWSTLVPLAHGYSSNVPSIGTASEIYNGPSGNFMFKGFQVELTQVMPTTEANDQIVAILGDLTLGAYLGQRRGLTIEQDNSVYFANDQIGIRGIERIAINAYGVGDTTDAGPICALIMKAS